MAAETQEITESNQDIQKVIAEMLVLVREMHAALEEFRPLLDKYVNNPAAKWRRRAIS